MPKTKSAPKKKYRLAPNCEKAILKKLSEQLLKGELFTDRHLPCPSDLTKVFMPIAMGGFSDYSKEELETVGLMYEHMDKACPMAVNGMPTFLSVRVLNKDDAAYVLERCERLKKALEAVE